MIVFSYTCYVSERKSSSAETRCREINIGSHPSPEFVVEQSETVENLNVPGGILYCHGRNDIVPTPFSRKLIEC